MGRHTRPADDARARGGAAGVARAIARRSADPTVALLISQLTAAGAAFVANVLAARAMSAGGRGEIALMLQVAYVGSHLALLGTQTSFVAVYFGASPGPATRSYARLLRTPLLVGLAGTVVVGTLPVFGLTDWRTSLALVAAFTVVNAFVTASRSISTAVRKQTEFCVYMLVSQSMLIGSLLVVFAFDVDDTRVWMLAYVLATSVPTAVLLARWRRLDGNGEGDRDRMQRARREGMTLLPAAMANMGMMRADRLVLPALASTSALGLYATVGTMTELLAWPLKAYADTRLGAWRAQHDRGRFRVASVVVSATVYAVVGGAVFGVVCYFLVVPLFGQRYQPAEALVVPLVVAAAVYGVSRISLAGLVARHRNVLASAADLLGFAVSLPAYLVLIPSDGALGAAYASLLGYSTCLVLATVALALVRGRDASPDETAAPEGGQAVRAP